MDAVLDDLLHFALTLVVGAAFFLLVRRLYARVWMRTFERVWQLPFFGSRSSNEKALAFTYILFAGLAVSFALIVLVAKLVT